MVDSITALCREAAGKACLWRRQLHEYPELGFQEFKTTSFIAERLHSFGGIDVHFPTSTGVVGVLRGGKPGKTIAFRADIDALPIHENPDHDPCSKVEGVMHACGHDAHTATLLGTAMVLSQLQNQLAGTVLFLFQPAEECPPGGAAAFVQAGALKGVDMVLGMHYHVPEDPGIFLVKPGPLFASTYSLHIRITGRGAHAAFPQTGVDSILLAANLVVALNTVIPRYIENSKRAVLTITGIRSSCSHNSMPETVELMGTIRILDRACERFLLTKVREISEGLCGVYQARCEVELQKGYDMVESTPAVASAVRSILITHFGEDHVKEPVPLMGGEDFSAYLNEAPGCYFRAGSCRRKPDGSVSPPHSSDYEFNDAALPTAVEAQVRILLELSETLDRQSGEKTGTSE